MVIVLSFQALQIGNSLVTTSDRSRDHKQPLAHDERGIVAQPLHVPIASDLVPLELVGGGGRGHFILQASSTELKIRIALRDSSSGMTGDAKMKPF